MHVSNFKKAGLQLGKDRLHCRIVFLVVWSRTVERLTEHLKINDLETLKSGSLCAPRCN
jgi:hypothetical protein